MRAESDSYRLVGYVSFCYLCKAGNVIVLVCHCVCMSVCLSVCLSACIRSSPQLLMELSMDIHKIMEKV